MGGLPRPPRSSVQRASRFHTARRLPARKREGWKEKRRRGRERKEKTAKKKKRSQLSFFNDGKEKRLGSLFSAPSQTPSPRVSNESLPCSCFGGAARLLLAAFRGELCPGERARGRLLHRHCFFSFSNVFDASKQLTQRSVVPRVRSTDINCLSSRASADCMEHFSHS